MELLKRKDRAMPSRESRLAAEAVIARATAAERAGGLRLDWARLGEGEARDLVDLTRRVRDGRIVDFTRLNGRERSRLGRLVEQAAGLEPGHFDTQREESATRTKMAELAARARRPAPKPALLPPGTVVLPASLGEDLRAGALWLNHVAAIVALEFSFETATPFSNRASFEGGGDALALCIDANMGPPFGQALGEDDILLNFKQVFSELEERGYYTAERNGKDWKIRRGPKALAFGKETR